MSARVPVVSRVARLAVSSRVAGQAGGRAVRACARSGDEVADHAGVAVGRGVAGGAGVGAEVAGEGRGDVHLLHAVEAVVGAVAEEALRTALVAQIASVEPVPTFAEAAVGRSVANETVAHR